MFESIFFYSTLLHYACEATNTDTVKYLVSLDKIDTKSRNDILN